jgi:hypothetical protein
VLEGLTPRLGRSFRLRLIRMCARLLGQETLGPRCRIERATFLARRFRELMVNLALEKHFTVPELSRLWGFSEDVIRGWFLERPRPGVLRHSVRKRGKREYVSLRISESAAAAMYAEKSGYE